MHQYDLAIYGHITIDRIINNFKEEVSLDFKYGSNRGIPTKIRIRSIIPE